MCEGESPVRVLLSVKPILGAVCGLCQSADGVDLGVFGAAVTVPFPFKVWRVDRTEESPTIICFETSFLSDNITLRIFDSRMFTTARSPLLAAFSTADRMIGCVKFEYSNFALWKGSVTAILTGSKPFESSVIEL
jgi:hypothetical protein